MNLKIENVSGMNLHYRYFPLKYFLDSMYEEGIYNIELWGGSPHIYYEDLRPDTIRSLKKELRIRNQKIIFYTPEQCMYPINIASDIKEIRERSIEYFKRNIEIANFLECDKMLVTSGTGYFDGTNHKAWEISVSSLQELTHYSEKYGITLGLEVLRNDETTLIHDRNKLKKMLDDIGESNIGVVLDTNPMAINKETISDYFDLLQDKMIHIHFIDGTPFGHLAWGDGSMSAIDYLKELQRFSYNGYLSLEITDSRYLTNPGRAVHMSMKHLNNVFDLLREIE